MHIFNIPVSIFQFFVFKQITKKHHYFPYFFPRKGTLTLTLGMGMGGDHLGPRNHKKSQKEESYGNGSHFWDNFQNNVENSFEISSYIQKTTPNPINTLKITIYNTKHTINTQIHFQHKFQIFKFKMISILWGFLWPFLVFVYFVYLHMSVFIIRRGCAVTAVLCFQKSGTLFGTVSSTAVSTEAI